MSHPPSLRRTIALGLGAAAVIGALPTVVQAAAGKTPAQVGSASYDRGREQLVIPIQGAAPKVRIRRLAPRQYIADLAGSVLLNGEAQGQRLRSPALAGWSLDGEETNRTVRLRMTLTTDSQPRVRYDGRLGGYVVSFATPAPMYAVRVPPKVEGRKPAPKVAAQPTAPKVDVAAKLAERRLPAVKPIPIEVATKPVVKPEIKVVTKPVVKPEIKVATKPVMKPEIKVATKPVQKPVLKIATKPAPQPVTKPVIKVAAKPIAKPAAVTAVKPIARPEIKVATKPVIRPEVKVAVKPVARPTLKVVAPKPVAVAPKPVAVAPRPVAVAPKPVVVAHQPVVAPKPAAHRTFVGSATRIGVPTWDAARGMLVVPYEGQLAPANYDVYRLSKRWSFLDIPHARPDFAGVRYAEVKEGVLKRWVMAKRPGRDTTRISFALGAPAAIAVQPGAHEILIAVGPQASMIGAAPKPAAPVVAAKPAPAAQPVVATKPAAPQAVTPLPAAPAVKPQALAVAPVKPAGRASVKPAAKPAPTALVRRNPVPGGTIETRLRRPFFDAERFGLVIPYEGRTPLYRWRQKTEGGVALELKGDVVSPAHLQPEARRHAGLGTWKFDRRPDPGTLGVEVAFARPSELVVAADPERKQLLLIPQPRLHAERAEEKAPARAALATAAIDRDGTNIFIPYRGETPRYTIEQVNPSFAYITFERAALSDDGVQFFAPDYHPTLNYWMVTQPEGTTTVRLAVALARPGAATVYQDPLNGRLVVVMGDHTPVVQASGRGAPRMPDPWPGAAQPGAGGEPVSLKEAS